jgi:uncharacterized phage infection (PIP) family protein YhgE
MDKSDKDIKETLSNIEILNNRLKNFETILNNFPILNSQFTQILQSLGSLQESLREINSPLSNFLNQQIRILQAFQNLPLSQESLQNLISQYSQILQAFLKSVPLQDFFKERAKRNELSKAVTEESEWWFTPSLMKVPPEYIDLAVQQYNNGNKEAISELFKEVYQSDNCKYLKEVVTSWKINPYFKSWMKFINDALEAHINIKYTLSIPVLLISSSGIARGYCKENIEGKERWMER